MTPAFIAYAASSGLVMALIARGLFRIGHPRRSLVAVLAFAGANGVFYLNSVVILGGTFRGTLWEATLLNLAMLLASLGRPHLLLSQLLEEDPDGRVGGPGQEQANSEHDSTRMNPAQKRLLVMIVLGVLLMEVIDPDLLL